MLSKTSIYRFTTLDYTNYRGVKLLLNSYVIFRNSFSTEHTTPKTSDSRANMTCNQAYSTGLVIESRIEVKMVLLRALGVNTTQVADGKLDHSS
jgi:hypothetical protein